MQDQPLGADRNKGCFRTQFLSHTLSLEEQLMGWVSLSYQENTGTERALNSSEGFHKILWGPSSQS